MSRALLKNAILKSLSPALTRKLRRYFVAREVSRRRYQPEAEVSMVRSLLLPGDFVADIGANVGAYTVEMSDLIGTAGRVYAFEPVSDNCAILKKVIKQTRLSNVDLFQLALGSQAGLCDIVIPKMEGFLGYYWAHVAQADEPGQRESVRMVTLDDLGRQGLWKRLDFIKCDVEGGELSVMRGAEQLLRAHHPAWLLEVSRPSSNEVFALFKDLGYRAFVFDSELIPTEFYRDKEFSNYFFFHTESLIWSRCRGW